MSNLTLSRPQKEAVETIEGHVMVIACPGAGKTTTLLERIHYIVQTKQVDPRSILMMTFTKAAAAEMKRRYIDRYMNGNTSLPSPTFCTIHSLCYTILQQFDGLRPDDVISGTDQRDFFYYRVRNMRSINDKDAFITDLLTDISVIKNNRIKPADYPQKCCTDNELFVKLVEAYDLYKSDNGLVDFDDLLLRAYKLITERADILEYLGSTYRYIQVDEYQDTNFLQRDIIYEISSKHGNLCIVGDDDQSIYAFRGAKPEVMLGFKDDFSDAKEIFMSTNYRSDTTIIDMASKLIRNNKTRFAKDFLASHTDKGNYIVQRFGNRSTEVLYIVDWIKSELEAGHNINDIAILYRTNKQAAAFANVLLRENIPFISNDPIPSKYDSWIFSDIRAFRRLGTGTGTKRDFLQVLNHPNRYLSGNEYQDAFTPGHIDQTAEAMYVIARNSGEESWKISSDIEKIKNFVSLIDMFGKCEPSRAIGYLDAVANYKKCIEEYASFRNKDESEFLEAYDGIKADARKMKSWDEWFVFINEYNDGLKKKSQKKDGVVLSTMHSAKGLEWRTVFIADVVENIVPFSKAEGTSAIEEERRLFYVAMTRAKKNLFICWYAKSEDGKSAKRSGFLDELEKKSFKVEKLSSPILPESTSDILPPMPKFL